MKRKRIFWVVITLLVVIMAAGYSYYATARSQAKSSQGQVSTEATTQMAVARAGDLTVSVSGSGELVPHSTIELSFPESGELVALNVKLGEEVQAGQVLASLRVDQSPVELAAEIASAELALITAQQKLDQLYEDAKIEAAQALLAVEEAQQALDELKNNAGELALAQQSVGQAKGAIADAEMQFYILNSTPSQ